MSKPYFSIFDYGIVLVLYTRPKVKQGVIDESSIYSTINLNIKQMTVKSLTHRKEHVYLICANFHRK